MLRIHPAYSEAEMCLKTARGGMADGLSSNLHMRKPSLAHAECACHSPEHSAFRFIGPACPHLTLEKIEQKQEIGVPNFADGFHGGLEECGGVAFWYTTRTILERQAMDAMTFWKMVGSSEVRRVVEEAGTTYAYFTHIAHKRKRPGPDLARRLVAASGGALTLEELLFPGSEKRAPTGPPSQERP